MYGLILKPEVDKIFSKLSKKDPAQLRIINKKIEEIRTYPDRDYKFLRKPLQNYNSAHIDSHFILIFRIDNEAEIVKIYYYDHHDFAYNWSPKK